MARYIDADKLDTRERGNNSQRTMWREIKRIVDNTPTADVVPKSEVEKLHEVIFMKEDLMQSIAKERNFYSDELEALKDSNEHLAVLLSEAKTEVAREIFKEIDCISYLFANGTIGILEVYYRLHKLKKKYTERCTDCKHFVGCECFDGQTCDEYDGGENDG